MGQNSGSVVLNYDENVLKQSMIYPTSVDFDNTVTTGVGDTEISEESVDQESSTIEKADEDIEFGAALGISGLGFGIVFAVLFVLMAFITVMSSIIRKGNKEKPVKQVKTVTPTPAPKSVLAVKEEEKTAVSEKDADMYVTLNGKRHAVSVEEKVPRFTVTVNGKSHGVDVESVEEE